MPVVLCSSSAIGLVLSGSALPLPPRHHSRRALQVTFSAVGERPIRSRISRDVNHRIQESRWASLLTPGSLRGMLIAIRLRG
jgi:hypothetical protein